MKKITDADTSTENFLPESKSFLSAITEAAPIVILIFDIKDARPVYLNRQFERLCEYDFHDIEKMNGDFLKTIVHPEDFPAVAQHFEAFLNETDDEAREIEFRLLHKNGNWLNLKSIDNPFQRDENGKVLQVISFIYDLTEEKKTDIQRFKLEAIIESSQDAIIGKDFDGKILSWNSGAEKLFGFKAEEVIGQNITIVFPVERLNEELKIMEKIRSGESVKQYETVRTNKDGKYIPVSLTVSPIKDSKGKIIGVSKIARDISENKIAEEALRQSEERYRVFIEQSSEGIWRFEVTEPISVDLPVEQQIELIFEKGYLAECNNAMAHQYGFPDANALIGKRLEDFLEPDNPLNYEYFRKFINSDYNLIDTESVESSKDGVNHHFSNNLVGIIEDGKLVRAWGTQRDITATRQAELAFQESEEQLRQSTKIEAIGRLAGGIAHDFNNFLAVIMLHVDMLNLQLPSESPLRFRLSEIKSVTNNAAEMVRQLLAFGRKQTLQPRPVVLNQVVKEFVKILRPLVGEDIEIQLELDSALGVCFVDHNQIIQVLMNLAVNARDAMPSGGVFRIETGNTKLDNNTPRHKAQPKGTYVELKVSDNGIGMETRIQERIFEPFFTTKESGKGTGLGLATVYGIIKQSNGFIWVESEIGKGTTFRVQLPRIDQPAAPVKKETPEVILRGSETILLVEDEEKIRRAAVEVLIVLGYQVLEAKHGMEAIEIASSYQKPINLLLTDVVMPRMNGRDLSEKIKQLHPEAAILFMSGYDDEIIARHGILEDGVQFISKPFSPGKLALKVRESLEKN